MESIVASAQMRLVVAGAAGRMGVSVIRAVAEAQGVVLAGALDAPGGPAIGRDAGELAGVGRNGVLVTHDASAALEGASGVIDFTIPAASVVLAAHSAARGLVHVIGTTGFTPDDDKAIAAAAGRARIVKSGNMSLGVNLLAALVRQVAGTLDEDFDIEIVEMHHKGKIDAPSGTALLLGQAAAAGRAVDLPAHAVHARVGHTGARKRGDIGFAVLRGGTVVGDHRVVFAGPHERIELAHKAEDRMIFARGALKAAVWAHGRPPGLYAMVDVLGLT